MAIGLIGSVTFVIYVTFPETAYNRSLGINDNTTTISSSGQRNRKSAKEEDTGTTEVVEIVPETANGSAGLLQGLRLYHGKYTNESIWQMTIRPVGLLILPPVLWTTLVMSVTIGFITAITSNVVSAFNTAYGFDAWQSGLCFVSEIIGCAFGIMLGGHFPDWGADYFTQQRNSGTGNASPCHYGRSYHRSTCLGSLWLRY